MISNYSARSSLSLQATVRDTRFETQPQLDSSSIGGRVEWRRGITRDLTVRAGYGRDEMRSQGPEGELRYVHEVIDIGVDYVERWSSRGARFLIPHPDIGVRDHETGRHFRLMARDVGAPLSTHLGDATVGAPRHGIPSRLPRARVFRLGDASLGGHLSNGCSCLPPPTAGVAKSASMTAASSRRIPATPSCRGDDAAPCVSRSTVHRYDSAPQPGCCSGAARCAPYRRGRVEAGSLFTTSKVTRDTR